MGSGLVFGARSLGGLNTKKLAVVFCLGSLAGGAFAQGLVNFFNSPTTLSSAWYPTNACYCFNFVQAVTSGSVGSWFYGLLIAPPGTTDPRAFAFSGAYATNLSVRGRFSGGGNVVVGGWAPGESMSYEIAIWSASLGHDWQNGWLEGNYYGEFGLSSIATGIAGGGGPVPLPPCNLFGGLTGIPTGFSTFAPIPEPASVALACLSATALLLFRRRKQRLVAQLKCQRN